MDKKYEFRSDIAISDSAFYAYGKDYAELLVNACLAVTDAMVEVKKIEEKIEEGVTVQADSVEQLLYNMLEEVIYLKDAKQLVFHSFEVADIHIEPPNCQVAMILKGDKISREKHEAHADVKAVTMKDFGIEKIKDAYRASVILDV